MLLNFIVYLFHILIIIIYNKYYYITYINIIFSQWLHAYRSRF